MHTLTVLFPVFINNKCFSCFALSLLFQVNRIFFLHFSFPFFPRCLSSFDFSFYLIFFATNTCFIKHLLRTYYVLKTVVGGKV